MVRANSEGVMNKQKIEWVVKGVLARNSRPGWGDQRELPVALGVWLPRARGMGIRSIVCLLTERQLLEYYAVHGLDLLDSYRQAGFEVALVPVPDFQWPSIEATELFTLRTHLSGLPPPWLVHWNEGDDRTGCAVDYLREKPEVVAVSRLGHQPSAVRKPRRKIQG